jgi:hypothetical protein
MALVSAALAMGACEDEGTGKLEPLPVELGLSQWPTSRCLPPESITTSLSLSTERSSKMVYEAEQPAVDYEYATALAKAFGFSEYPVYVAARTAADTQDSLARFFGPAAREAFYEAENEDALLEIRENTGVIEYWWKLAGTPEDFEIESLSDSEAVAIAQRYLDSVGLMPKDKPTQDVERGDWIKVVFTPANMPIDDRLNTRSITVDVTGSGYVRRVIYEWQDSKTIARYPIVSEAEALEHIRQCRGIANSSSSELDVVQVNLVYLGLPPIERPYRYFVPVYEFIGERGELGTPFALVLAIADEYLETPSPTETP